VKRKSPWWCWLAVFTFGWLSFVGLLVAGIKVKNKLWLGLGAMHLTLLIISSSMESSLFDLFMWLGIGLTIYLFVVVRKQYWSKLDEIDVQQDRATREAMIHQKYQDQLEEEKIRIAYEKQLNELKTQHATVQAWACTGCGAENHNVAGICDYCGVAMR